MSTPRQSGATGGSFLRKLGVREALGVSIAGMGPTLAMNLNPQEQVKHVGPLVPLVFLISCGLMLLVAWCFARLSRRHPNAGSIYGFVSAVMGPRAGFVAGWTLLGTYLAFGMVGISGFGLFRVDLATRLHPLHHPTAFFFTLTGAVAVTMICITAARLAAVILIVVEGVAILLMAAFATFVIWKVCQSPVWSDHAMELFIPRGPLPWGPMALAVSFGFLSFAGFEEVAAMGEEVREPERTIPRVLLGAVLGAGCVFVLVTSAEILGFGMDAAGLKRLCTSDSLLGDLGSSMLGPRCGDLLDVLAIGSALGGGLASVMAASRILFAMARDLAPGSRVARLSARGGAPVFASLVILSCIVAGYLVMKVLFHAAGSDPFFWASTLGALGLLVAYLMTVICAAVSVIRERKAGEGGILLIPVIAGVAILGTLWSNLWPPQAGAYAILPWVVLGWGILPLGFFCFKPLRPPG